MYFIVIYIIYQKSVLFKYVFSITIESSYSELKLAVQYNSETDERYSPWIQAIKSLNEKFKKVALTLLFPISTNMFLIQNTSELVNQMSLFQKDYSSATGSFRNFVS